MLDRYQVIRELGVGASARVLLVLDQRDQRLVALKQLLSTVSFTGGARMRREFRALSSLKHPNIIEVLDYGEHEGVPFLALEFIDGQTLHTWFRSRPHFAEIRSVFAQLCDALEVVHEAGLLHRDLKPENVMLNNKNVVKLMDFGLSKLSDASVHLTRAGAMVGTVLYMSPEQCRGVELDARADLYAVGIMLYEALTGRLPFKSNSIPEALLAHLQATPRAIGEVRSDVPIELEDLTMRLLAKEPSQRPFCAADVAAILRGVQSKVQVTTKQLLVAPMIGRNLELAALKTALEPVHSVVALLGEAGIGKTRLLRELKNAVPDLLEVRCLESDAPGDWFTRLQLILNPDAPTRILQSSMSDLERLARYEALRILLEGFSGVLVFEDLHFATSEDLRHLAHGLRSANQVRAVYTYRPEDLAYGAERHLPVADTSITLTPLANDAMQHLIEARLGAPVEASIRAVLLERSGGNPWLLEERLRAMLENRSLLERDGMFEWNRDQQIPNSIAEILERRFEDLSAVGLDFARAGAVLGTHFDYEDARAVLGWDDDTSISALEDGLRVRVLSEIPNTRGNGYKFAHPEYAAKLRGDLPAQIAKQYHAAAAQRLITRASAVELCEHHAIAENYMAALEYGVQGGETALQNLQYALAERGFRTALEASAHINNMPINTSHLRARATFGLAETLKATGHIFEAEKHYREVAYHADAKIESKAILRLADLLTARGEPIRALEILAREKSLEARLAKAKVAFAMSDIAAARHQALKIWAELKGHQDVLELDVLLLLGQITINLGQYDRTLIISRNCQAKLEVTQEPLRYLQCRRLAANAYSGKRQWSKALEVHNEIAEEATRCGHLELQIFSLNNTAVILTLEDEVDTALNRFERAGILAKRADDRELENIAAENTVLCHSMLGQLEQALAVAQRFDSAAALIWRYRLERFLGTVCSSLPNLEMVPAWHHGLYALANIEALLEQQEFATVLITSQEPHKDYLWFWTLYECTARIALGMEYKEALGRLARPIGDCGIKRQLGREHAVLLRDALEKKLSTEQLTQARVGVIGIALRALNL